MVFPVCETPVSNLASVSVDPVHLEHPLRDVESVCRRIHFGPPFLKWLVSKLHFGTLMPSGSGGPVQKAFAPGGGAVVHSISTQLRHSTVLHIGGGSGSAHLATTVRLRSASVSGEMITCSFPAVFAACGQGAGAGICRSCATPAHF